MKSARLCAVYLMARAGIRPLLSVYYHVARAADLSPEELRVIRALECQVRPGGER